MHAARHAEDAHPGGVEQLVADAVAPLTGMAVDLAQPVAAAHAQRGGGLLHQWVIAHVVGGDLHEAALFDQEGERKTHDLGFGRGALVQRPVGIVGEAQRAGAFVLIDEAHRADRAVVTATADQQELVGGFLVGIVAQALLDALAHDLDG